ncbi:MAG: hypothetical protein IJS29_10400 [Selenomonadaceae bacterium]|nr:hypothetical protein [Selenomonadaceae bacterium]
MASTWDKIPQTHRTILFEQFTHPLDNSTTNLYDILSVFDDSSMSDEELSKDIENKLEVSSFDEFIKKFSPKVYEYVTGTADGVPSVQYTTDPVLAKKYQNREIELTKHTYFEMLVNMYSQKGDSGIANIDFDDAKVREILTPKREIEALYDKRRQLPLLMEKYDNLVKKNENPAAIVKRIKQTRQEAVQQLQAPTAIIALGMADAQQKIELIDKGLKQLDAPSAGESEDKKLLSGTIGFNNEGRLVLIPAKTSAPDDEKVDSPSDPNGDNMKKLAAVMKGDLDKKAPPSTDDYTKALVISGYTGVDIQLSTPFEEMDRTALVEYREELVAKKNILENVFKQMKETFVKELSEIVQKVLSVKIFFDHATVKGTNSATLPKAGLIVTNCNASKLIDAGVKDKFSKVMEHFGKVESGNKKIWFAILPNVMDENFEGSTNDENNGGGWEDDLFSDVELDEEKISTDAVDFNAAKSLLQIMDDSKIMTLFNFAPTEQTTFSNINPKTIDAIADKFADFKKEHAVYAMPNFTIMKAGTVPLNDEPDAPKITVPAIYINAAYVAAGLLVAAQQPDFWISRGFKNKEDFLTENACVRIDLESGEVTRKLLTKFNRERSIEWSKDVLDAFTKKRFGFVFDGDRKYDEKANKFIDNTYILNARTLDRNDQGEYQPIFAVLMKDFVDTYKRTYGSPLTTSKSKDFFRVAGDWTRQSKKYNPAIINLILRDGEEIIQEGSTWKIQLKSGEKIIDVSLDVKVVDA